MELLSRLDATLPEYHFCHYKSKLVRNKHCQDTQKAMPKRKATNDDEWDEPKPCEILLIMTQYIFGSTDNNFKLRLEQFACAKTWSPLQRNSGPRSLYMLDVEPIIIEDQLHLRTTVRMWTSRQYALEAIGDPDTDWNENNICFYLEDEDGLHFSDYLCKELMVAAVQGATNQRAITSADVIIDGRYTYAKCVAVDHQETGIEMICEYWENLGNDRHSVDRGIDGHTWLYPYRFEPTASPPATDDLYLSLRCKRDEVMPQSATDPATIEAAKMKWIEIGKGPPAKIHKMPVYDDADAL